MKRVFRLTAAWNTPDRLDFPEPAVIYLNRAKGIPEESVLHISFGSQGSFDYKVKNFLYLAHDTEELNRRKMAILEEEGKCEAFL